MSTRSIYHSSKHAFSLVELSIVLVILGLLIGGILSGQALIRASELRSVTTEYTRYITATQTFRDKYFALPGDMTNATAFWDAAHATPATCVTTAGTGTQTCNGNGDGAINWSTAGSNETFRFWQHLANAGLIEGTYDGISHGINPYGASSANSPTGKLSSSLWYVDNTPTFADMYRFSATYNNYFNFGAIRPGGDPINPIFKPEEMWNIDTKIDDGKPATGKLVVVAFPAGLSACTTTVSNNPATLSADYLLSATSLTCAAYFRQAF
jgi:prepilin-type N-terminal cleavage/methylation domain-containing protein